MSIPRGCSRRTTRSTEVSGVGGPARAGPHDDRGRLGTDVAAAAARVAEVDLVVDQVVAPLLDPVRLVEEQAAGDVRLRRVHVAGDGVAAHDGARAEADLDPVLRGVARDERAGAGDR